MKEKEIGVIPSNPSDAQRYEMLKVSLAEEGRLCDLNSVVRLLSPPPSIQQYADPGQLKKVRVGIIGGGLAGMSAAFELRMLGCDITIFDALEDRIGGRVYTYYFDDNKTLYGEFGALRIPISHETTWYYINKFGLNTSLFIQDNPSTFVYVEDTRVRNKPEEIQQCIYPKYRLTRKERETPWPTLLNYALNHNLNQLSPAIRTEILKTLPIYSKPYAKLIDASFLQNLQSVGLTPDAINMIGSIDPLDGAALDISYDEILGDNYPAAFSAPLYRINGGTSNLPKAFYQSLLSPSPKEYKIHPSTLGKITWKGATWVDGIFLKKDGEEISIRYKNKKTNVQSTETFDYVICAIPFSTLSAVELRPLFSNKKMDIIRNANYVNAHRTLLLCKKRFWEENTDYGKINGGISVTDLSIKTIIYPSDHVKSGYNPNEPGVLIGSYNLNKYATHMGNSNRPLQSELVKRQVEQVHGLPPNYLDAIVTGVKSLSWNNDDNFRGAFAYFTPQQKKLYGCDIAKPEYNDRIFFAGEHTSNTHSWMQGALYTGKLAANELARASTCKGTKNEK